MQVLRFELPMSKLTDDELAALHSGFTELTEGPDPAWRGLAAMIISTGFTPEMERRMSGDPPAVRIIEAETEIDPHGLMRLLIVCLKMRDGAIQGRATELTWFWNGLVAGLDRYRVARGIYLQPPAPPAPVYGAVN